MNKTQLKIILLLTLLFFGQVLFAQGFVLSSKDISGQLSSKEVFSGFGCKGDNISPQLFWDKVPEGTKSFALTVYDPDAPTGSGWWHWLIFDIAANERMLKANAGNLSAALAPATSIQSITSFGQPGYGGACPPKGDKAHQYIFTIYALKTKKTGLTATAMPALVGFYLQQNMLAKASIVAYYSR